MRSMRWVGYFGMEGMGCTVRDGKHIGRESNREGKWDGKYVTGWEIWSGKYLIRGIFWNEN